MALAVTFAIKLDTPDNTDEVCATTLDTAAEAEAEADADAVVETGAALADPVDDTEPIVADEAVVDAAAADEEFALVACTAAPTSSCSPDLGSVSSPHVVPTVLNERP